MVGVGDLVTLIHLVLDLCFKYCHCDWLLKSSALLSAVVF